MEIRKKSYEYSGGDGMPWGKTRFSLKRLGMSASSQDVESITHDAGQIQEGGAPIDVRRYEHLAAQDSHIVLNPSMNGKKTGFVVYRSGVLRRIARRKKWRSSLVLDADNEVPIADGGT